MSRTSFATKNWKDLADKPENMTQMEWDAYNSSKFNGFPFPIREKNEKGEDFKEWDGRTVIGDKFLPDDPLNYTGDGVLMQDYDLMPAYQKRGWDWRFGKSIPSESSNELITVLTTEYSYKFTLEELVKLFWRAKKRKVQVEATSADESSGQRVDSYIFEPTVAEKVIYEFDEDHPWDWETHMNDDESWYRTGYGTNLDDEAQIINGYPDYNWQTYINGQPVIILFDLTLKTGPDEYRPFIICKACNYFYDSWSFVAGRRRSYVLGPYTLNGLSGYTYSHEIDVSPSECPTGTTIEQFEITLDPITGKETQTGEVTQAGIRARRGELLLGQIQVDANGTGGGTITATDTYSTCDNETGTYKPRTYICKFTLSGNQTQESLEAQLAQEPIDFLQTCSENDLPFPGTTGTLVYAQNNKDIVVSAGSRTSAAKTQGELSKSIIKLKQDCRYRITHVDQSDMSLSLAERTTFQDFDGSKDQVIHIDPPTEYGSKTFNILYNPHAKSRQTFGGAGYHKPYTVKNTRRQKLKRQVGPTLKFFKSPVCGDNTRYAIRTTEESGSGYSTFADSISPTPESSYQSNSAHNSSYSWTRTIVEYADGTPSEVTNTYSGTGSGHNYVTNYYPGCDEGDSYNSSCENGVNTINFSWYDTCAENENGSEGDSGSGTRTESCATSGGQVLMYGCGNETLTSEENGGTLTRTSTRSPGGLDITSSESFTGSQESDNYTSTRIYGSQTARTVTYSGSVPEDQYSYTEDTWEVDGGDIEVMFLLNANSPHTGWFAEEYETSQDLAFTLLMPNDHSSAMGLDIPCKVMLDMLFVRSKQNGLDGTTLIRERQILNGVTGQELIANLTLETDAGTRKNLVSADYLILMD